MVTKAVLKETEQENWTIQYSRNKGGVMINSRGNSVEEVYKNYVQACALLYEEVQEEKYNPELPFYGEGSNLVQPYKKKDGSVGYEIGKDGSPQKCPTCGSDKFDLVNGQWGNFWKCNSDSQIIRIKKEK